jgi:hypothetical protein
MRFAAATAGDGGSDRLWSEAFRRYPAHCDGCNIRGLAIGNSKIGGDRMTRFLLALGLSLGLGAFALTGTSAPVHAQKAGKGEKVCKIKLKYTGQIKTFVCKVDEPCCVWHEINYVKCGSPVFKCL